MATEERQGLEFPKDGESIAIHHKQWLNITVSTGRYPN